MTGGLTEAGVLVGGSKRRTEIFDTIHWRHVLLLFDSKSQWTLILHVLMCA